MAHQEDELTGIEGDVDVVQRGLVGLRGIDLGEVLAEDHRLHARLLGGTALVGVAVQVLRREDRGEVRAGERGVQVGNLALLVHVRGGRGGTVARAERGRVERVGRGLRRGLSRRLRHEHVRRGRRSGRVGDNGDRRIGDGSASQGVDPVYLLILLKMSCRGRSGGWLRCLCTRCRLLIPGCTEVATHLSSFVCV